MGVATPLKRTWPVPAWATTTDLRPDYDRAFA